MTLWFAPLLSVPFSRLCNIWTCWKYLTPTSLQVRNRSITNRINGLSASIDNTLRRSTCEIGGEILQVQSLGQSWKFQVEVSLFLQIREFLYNTVAVAVGNDSFIYHTVSQADNKLPESIWSSTYEQFRQFRISKEASMPKPARCVSIELRLWQTNIGPWLIVPRANIASRGWKPNRRLLL